MPHLPPKILQRLKHLREEMGRYIEIKHISGHFYAFEVNGRWDQKTKKKIKKYTYLGKISEDGTFIPGKHREEGTLDSANAEQKIGKYDEAILTNLSMNARMPVPMLAKRLGLSVTATRYQIQRLEKRMGIKYTLEMMFGAMGYTQFVIFVKFLSRKPELNELKHILSDEPHIQFAVLTKGSFDLIIYLLEDDSYKTSELVWKLRTETNLRDYDSSWSINTFYREYGVVPLRQEFINKVLRERIIKRTKGKSIKSRYGLHEREFAVIKELNEDSKTDFTDIDNKYGLSRGSAQYAYYKLRQSEVINRPTISMDYFKYSHIGVITISCINVEEFIPTQNRLFLNILTNNGLINKYSLIGDIGSPNGAMLFVPILNVGELDNISEKLKEDVKGIEVETLIATNILVGSFCYRLMDNDYSIQYENLVKNRVVPQKQRTNYE